MQSRSTQRDETQLRVLRAAESLFHTQGFRSTTIRQIAVAAGVSTGTVMARGDKDALLVAVFDGWIESIHAYRDEAVDDTPLEPEEARAAVLELFEPFVSYFAGDADLAREYASIIVRGHHESAIFRGLGDRLTAEVEARLVRAGFSDPPSAARTIYLAYLGLLMIASHGTTAPTEATRDLQRVIRHVTTPTTGGTP